MGYLLGGFSFYLANFANYGVTYGSLGAAVGLLLPLPRASVVLLGAELNAAIYHLLTDTKKRTKTAVSGSDRGAETMNAG